MYTILLIEDDENLNRGIGLKLSREGYRVLPALTVKAALEWWQKESVHMVISDISLPDGDGLSFGRKVRAESDAYLVYLTAMDQEIDVINGYDSGADDYMTKPFSVAVLVSKVNALMRRIKIQERGLFKSEPYEVSTQQMSVTKEGVPIVLSKTEFKLLVCLLQEAGRIVTKEHLLETVWGLEGQFVDDNTVAVNISRLKHKLGTQAITNVRGLGYTWTAKVEKRE